MLTLRLGTAAPIRVATGGRGGLWAPLSETVEGLELSVTDLGEGRIGLCPDAEHCVPVPPEAVDHSGGAPFLDLQLLAPALGLAIAHDAAGRRAVVVPGDTPEALDSPPGRSGAASGVVLPDLRTGAPTPLGALGRRSVVFAWASW